MSAVRIALYPDTSGGAPAPESVLADIASVGLTGCYCPAVLSDDGLARFADLQGADVVCVEYEHMPPHRILLADDGRAVHYVRSTDVELVFGTKAEVNAACGDDRAAGPVGMPRDEKRVWLGVVTHRPEL